VAAGEIKSFTGVSADAPYEPPPNPEINLPNYRMTVDESVEMLMSHLRKNGVLSGGPTNPMGE
jgi:adenylylsulfate kinase-like enzyme